MRFLGLTPVTTLLFAITACGAAPMHWQRLGTSDAAKDEVECRAEARQEAARQLPYGDGPPIFVYRDMSMLQWTQAIDNERYYLEDDLMKVCMRQRGFELVRVSS
jgi:hypothetical protein